MIIDHETIAQRKKDADARAERIGMVMAMKSVNRIHWKPRTRAEKKDRAHARIIIRGTLEQFGLRFIPGLFGRLMDGKPLTATQLYQVQNAPLA